MTLFDDEFLVRQVVQQISNYFSLTSREPLSYQRVSTNKSFRCIPMNHRWIFAWCPCQVPKFFQIFAPDMGKLGQISMAASDILWRLLEGHVRCTPSSEYHTQRRESTPPKFLLGFYSKKQIHGRISPTKEENAQESKGIPHRYCIWTMRRGRKTPTRGLWLEGDRYGNWRHGGKGVGWSDGPLGTSSLAARCEYGLSTEAGMMIQNIEFMPNSVSVGFSDFSIDEGSSPISLGESKSNIIVLYK